MARITALAALTLILTSLGLLASAASSAIQPQVSESQVWGPQSGEPGTWTKYSGNPVLTPSQAWEGDALWAAYVIKDSSIYKMWYTGRAAIGYASSTDGITWAKNPSNPVLTPGPSGTWDERVGEPSVIIQNGIYKMWYWGRRADGIRQTGYATSPDGITWTKYAGNPVLRVGGPGSWDELEAGTPFVLYQNGVYKMWYTGQDSALRYAIGYATSLDGINWTKYGSNPILVGTPETWDEGGVLAGKIYFDGVTYRMWYFGKDNVGTDRIGYATSPDGITWTKYSGNPVLDRGSSGAWDSDLVSWPTVLLENSVYKMWYCGIRSGEGSIGYATAPEIGGPTCPVPFFWQRDPRWREHPLRTNGQCSPECGTIGACGCTLTSAAMLFSYYGANLNPPTLSDCMGMLACPFSWGTGASCTNGRARWIGRYGFSWSRLDQELNQNHHPVLLGMHKGNQTHWVLIISGRGSDPANYIMHDPWYEGGANMRLDARTARNWVLDALAVYDGQPTCESTTPVILGLDTINPQPVVFAESGRVSSTRSQPALSGTGDLTPSPVVTGTAYVYWATAVTMTVHLTAYSSAGNVTEMLIWTDTITNTIWQPYTPFVWLPVSDLVYARFRDEFGNESEIYSDTTDPVYTPTNPPWDISLPVILKFSP